MSAPAEAKCHEGIAQGRELHSQYLTSAASVESLGILAIPHFQWGWLAMGLLSQRRATEAREYGGACLYARGINFSMVITGWFHFQSGCLAAGGCFSNGVWTELGSHSTDYDMTAFGIIISMYRFVFVQPMLNKDKIIQGGIRDILRCFMIFSSDIYGIALSIWILRLKCAVWDDADPMRLSSQIHISTNTYNGSEYNMGTGVTAGVPGPTRTWETGTIGSVSVSASLYSMVSGSFSISGLSVFRSLTTSSLNKLMRAVRIRQHTGTLKRSHMQSMKMRIQLCQDPIQQIPEEEESLRKNRERRLPPIGFQEQPRELQRNCPATIGLEIRQRRTVTQLIHLRMCSQDCDTYEYVTKLKKHVYCYIVGIVGIVIV
ncbi:hypothetical protein G5I_10222 [Acromyrmex echinatior]|uniref:Uncharacterized protein n=1 Tax=Acromyrmex echinatior TaxID=103372 RepID=F4WWA7_ACREC|nr:hypothetical protein G5I_10222 [Acromyrmex echinatior]